MEYFPIRSFRPIEAREENTDQDRTVLRLCEGMLAVPNGALCTGPRWKSLWGLGNLTQQINEVLTGADQTKAHALWIYRTNHGIYSPFIVFWSPSLGRPLGLFYAGLRTPSDLDFDGTGNVIIQQIRSDLDPQLPWFGSRIANRWYFGNGVDLNLYYDSSGSFGALGPSSPPSASDIYNKSRVRIPPCTSFVMAGNRSIFASGNAAAPKRVWITHPPDAAFPFNEGIYSTDTSYIDLSYSEATKITALSAFQNYITAHTDAKPVNLYDVDGATDGFKCVQAPSAANSSAPCPSCVRDANGLTSFYLGADGEIYKDEAIRVGPHDKRASRNQDIATTLAANSWNRDMRKPVVAGMANVVYDRKGGGSVFWIFAEPTLFTGYQVLWAFNERNGSVCGPLRSPTASVVTAISDGTEGTLVAIIDRSGNMLYADLSAVGETEQFLLEDNSAALGSPYLEEASAPTPTPGLSYVAATADVATFREGGGALNAKLATVWSAITDSSAGSYTRYWNNAYIARVETGYMDFGDARLVKNYLEVSLTWQRHSRAYVGIYAETEDGRRDGKWLGLCFTKETQKTPINLSGRRIRLRLVIVCFNNAPALLRDITIGWGPQGRT